MIHVDSTKSPGTFFEGDDILFRFEITDTLTGQGISGAAPAAWMEPGTSADATECKQKISAFVGGSIFSRAELDLNVYYVLVMNDDATITVVDPLFGFGGTQLLALIGLESPGMDWAKGKKQEKIFVSLPLSGKVAVINTFNWKVMEYIPLNAEPYSTTIQPDGAYLWVDFTSNKIEGFSGVAVIGTDNHQLKKTIQTGAGAHEVIITDDNRYVCVTNADAQTVSVIDVATLQKVKDISLDEKPVSMTWSSLAKAVYVAAASGKIWVIDPERQKIITTVQAREGLSDLSFEPTGRLAFIVNTPQSLIQILDAASNRIVQTGDMEPEPDQVMYSDEIAYVRHKASEQILMIPLDQVGQEGQRLQAADFPGGQHPAGKCDMPSLAPGMVQAPGGSAMLLANPMDKAIFYYMEGMAAPMGSFSNYERTPRAVEVIDRSLEERAPGVYETVAKIRGYGEYDIAVFLDVPRVTHCFEAFVQIDEDKEIKRKREKIGNVAVEHLTSTSALKAHEKHQLRFRLIDPITKEPLVGLTDVAVRGTSPSNWFFEEMADEQTEEGVYTCEVELPDTGIYYIYVGCPSKGLAFNNPQYLVLRGI